MRVLRTITGYLLVLLIAAQLSAQTSDCEVNGLCNEKVRHIAQECEMGGRDVQCIFQRIFLEEDCSGSMEEIQCILQVEMNLDGLKNVTSAWVWELAIESNQECDGVIETVLQAMLEQELPQEEMGEYVPILYYMAGARRKNPSLLIASLYNLKRHDQRRSSLLRKVVSSRLMEEFNEKGWDTLAASLTGLTDENLANSEDIGAGPAGR